MPHRKDRFQLGVEAKRAAIALETHPWLGAARLRTIIAPRAPYVGQRRAGSSRSPVWSTPFGQRRAVEPDCAPGVAFDLLWSHDVKRDVKDVFIEQDRLQVEKISGVPVDHDL